MRLKTTSAYFRTLDFNDAVPHEEAVKIFDLEEFYGTIKLIRIILADVLAEKIAGGFLTEEMALQIARRILNTNAIELYEIEK